MKNKNTYGLFTCEQWDKLRHKKHTHHENLRMNKPQLKWKAFLNTYKYAWLCNLEKHSMEDWRMKRHTIYATRSWRTMTNRKFTFGICLNMAEVFKEKSVVIAVIPRFHSMNMWTFRNWMFIHMDTYFGFIIRGNRVNTPRF